MDGVGPRAEAVLRFWFGDDPAQPLARREVWFKKDHTFDNAVRNTFGEDVARARAGEYDGWSATPQGALALILLHDQFTRNIYRETPACFAQDVHALRICLNGQAAGLDAALPTVQRWFFYMPMMHSEELDIQERMVSTIERMQEEAAGEGEEIRDLLADVLKYAIAHRDVIAKYGRFPHRNPILGRDSSPDEVAYMNQPGSGF